MNKRVLVMTGINGITMLCNLFSMIRDHGNTWLTPAAGLVFVLAACLAWIGANILFDTN
jgi:hypothetical protein